MPQPRRGHGSNNSQLTSSASTGSRQHSSSSPGKAGHTTALCGKSRFGWCEKSRRQLPRGACTQIQIHLSRARREADEADAHGTFSFGKESARLRGLSSLSSESTEAGAPTFLTYGRAPSPSPPLSVSPRTHTWRIIPHYFRRGEQKLRVKLEQQVGSAIPFARALRAREAG